MTWPQPALTQRQSLIAASPHAQQTLIAARGSLAEYLPGTLSSVRTGSARAGSTSGNTDMNMRGSGPTDVLDCAAMLWADWQQLCLQLTQHILLQNWHSLMSSTGDIYPCCWLGFSPQKYNDDLYHGNEQLKQLMNNAENNGVTHGLEKAVSWFTLVKESWRKKTIKEGRLYRCDLHCGKN